MIQRAKETGIKRKIKEEINKGEVQREKITVGGIEGN